MMKKIAIVQSNYIPWKGYFDLIAAVDEFVLYDEMQYTKRDWRNRNVIKTPGGLQWLTVPVKVKGKYHQKISDTEIDGEQWAEDHWKSLSQNYKRALFFHEISEWLEPIYRNEKFRHLSSLNRRLIIAICEYFGIKTKITESSSYRLPEGKTERLVGICTQAGAGEYISGPSAKEYIKRDVFAARGVDVVWFDYQHYPEHPQLWGEFKGEVSILDLLFNCGPNSLKYMKYTMKS